TGVTVNILVPGGPTDTPGFFPPGKPRPPFLLDPEIMGAPAVWLASPQSDGVRPSPFSGRAWDVRLSAAEAAAPARAAAGCASPRSGEGRQRVPRLYDVVAVRPSDQRILRTQSRIEHEPHE